MKLHLPKPLFTALLAVLTLAAPAEAATYYLNAADESTSTDISASFTETSEGVAKDTSSNFWQKFCSGQDGYDGPHQLVIDQARTEGNKIKLDFAPFCVTGINVTSGATNNYIYRENAVDSIIFGNAAEGADAQSSSFAENFTLEHQGSGSIELIGKQTWTITDDKTLTLNGNVKNTGTSTISGGAVSINRYDADSQGNLTNTGALTIDTALSVAGSITNDGTLTVNDGATLKLARQITNSGTLNLNGGVRADSLSGFRIAAAGTGANTSNGFLENIAYTVAAGSGTVNIGEGAVLTLGSGETATTHTLQGNGTNTAYFNGEADANTYYVFANGNTSDITTAVTTGSKTLSEIYVDSAATLQYDSGSFGGVTLTGDGIYKLNHVAKGTNFSNTTQTYGSVSATGWTGTVQISGGEKKTGNTNDQCVKGIDFDIFGNANSTVEITTDNLYGYFLNSTTFDTNLKLTGSLFLQNGNATQPFYFAGKVSGSGDFNIARTGGDNNSYYFRNDISQWTGQINHTSGQTSGLYFDDKANDVWVTINRTAGTLNMTVQTDAAATFHKAVSVSTLTLTQSATFTSTVASTGVVSIGTGKTMTLGSAGTASTIGRLDAAAATVSLAENASLTLGGGTNAVTHAIGTLNTGSGSTVTLNSGANLTLKSVAGLAVQTITGQGTLRLNYASGSVFNWNKDIFKDSIGKLQLDGNSVYELTSSTNNPGYLNKASVIEVVAGATLSDRLTGYTLGDTDNTLILSGAGYTTTDEYKASALALGYSCSGGGNVKVGYNVELGADATIWTAARANNSGTITGYLNEQLKGNGHTLTKTGAGELVLEKGADNASLNVSAGSLNLKSTTTSESVTVTSGATLKLDTAATITSRQDANASMTKVSMSTAGISTTATDGTKGTISNANVEIAQLAEDASFTIQDMTLTDTTISATTVDTKVNLQNVEASNVVLDKGKFSTDAPMSVVGAGGTAFSASTSAITEGSSITINASKGASLTVDLGDLTCVTAMGPGKYNLSITLNGVGFDSYENLAAGSGIIFAADSWLGELISASSDVKVSFSAVEEATPAAVAEGGAATGVTYSTGSVGTVITITGLNVPEPASATLGLAALMMLCSRRRRKA